MEKEEILKYARIFSTAKGDTYKIRFVNENKTINEPDLWKEVLNLIDKQDKAINRLAQWVANLNSIVDKQSVIEIIYKEIENE